MNKSILIKAATLALTVLVIAGCANTKPIGEWSNKSFSGNLNNILIIGVTSRSDRRQVFEAKFVEGLAALKVKATPSYELIESSLYLSRAVVENAIKGQDIEAVLVTRIAGVKEKEVYRAPDNQDENLSYFSYYDKSFHQANDGYTAQYRTVALETNLYDTESGDLVWSMQSETMDASQPRQVIEDQIELTINTLAKRGLIGE
ncbi:MAG: YpiF family protein [Gammaproteobacteria bacterium]|nr:YpiF family protein [Gammaproteobacteria bacterium]